MKFEYLKKIDIVNIIKIIYSIKWDFIFLFISFIFLIAIHIYLRNNVMIPKAQFFERKDFNFPYLKLKEKHLKDSSYEIKRDIFNFYESKGFAKALFKDNEEKENDAGEIPSIIYNGMIMMGKEKIFTFSNEGKEYIGKEGDIIENKFKIIKGENDYLLLLYLPINKLMRIQAKS